MDDIYGMIPLDTRLFKFIDTPHFQRLRYIKQLGASYLCFPTANHTRFCHSIGTSYLAGELYDKLYDPTLDLRPVDKLLIQTAGLLHDLGHGPFSHAFEHSILPKMLGNHEWNHEAQGLRLIDHLIESEEIDLFDTHQTRRLRQILTGEIPSEFKWMNQIISNSDFGIDVDRIDYLVRDAYNVGSKCGFDFTVLSSHVNIVNGNIAFHIKRQPELLNFFQTRYTMYNQIYNHPITKSIEYMLVDAILDSEPILKIRDAIGDPEKFLTLNDSIYNIIERDGSDLAKKNINRINRRDFYKLVYSSDTPPPAEMAAIENAIVDRVSHNYGQGDKNPLTMVPYYGTSKLERKLILPERFEQIEYRVYRGGGQLSP